MKNYLAFFLILGMTAASAHGPLPARLTGPSNLVRVGLTDNDAWVRAFRTVGDLVS